MLYFRLIFFDRFLQFLLVFLFAIKKSSFLELRSEKKKFPVKRMIVFLFLFQRITKAQITILSDDDTIFCCKYRKSKIKCQCGMWHTILTIFLNCFWKKRYWVTTMSLIKKDSIKSIFMHWIFMTESCRWETVEHFNSRKPYFDVNTCDSIMKLLNIR